MPNTFFQFKQFLINQEKSGMKVTTDGCLFGAWVANDISQMVTKQILDIGTGTGLLSLMLAQITSNTKIHAIDINENAFSECSENFEQSSWSERLHCHHTSLQEYQPTQKYDLIVCNPPFFKDNFKGLQSDKNQAIHADHLSLSELIEGISRLLDTDGKVYILYPEIEMLQFIIEAKKINLFLDRLTIVKNKNEDKVFRMMGKFSSKKSELCKDEILIRETNNTYSKTFWNLVEPYYL